MLTRLARNRSRSARWGRPGSRVLGRRSCLGRGAAAVRCRCFPIVLVIRGRTRGALLQGSRSRSVCCESAREGCCLFARWTRAQIPAGGGEGAVTHRVLDRDEIDARRCEQGSIRVPQVVKAKGSRRDGIAPLLEALPDGHGVERLASPINEHELARRREVGPAPEALKRVGRLNRQWDPSDSPALCCCLDPGAHRPADGEDGAVEVNISPPHSEELAEPQPGVCRDAHELASCSSTAI
jgi:hypothetical protein